MEGSKNSSIADLDKSKSLQDGNEWMHGLEVFV